MSLNGLKIGVVIPTRNEAGALPTVLANMPDFVDDNHPKWIKLLEIMNILSGNKREYQI